MSEVKTPCEFCGSTDRVELYPFRSVLTHICFKCADEMYNQTKNDMPQVRFSLLIKHPSPDLQNDPEYMRGREIFNSTMALDELSLAKLSEKIGGIAQVNGIAILPAFISEFLLTSWRSGAHRVELLIGETEYKMYVKPEQTESQQG